MKPAKKLTDIPMPGVARRLAIPKREGLHVEYCCWRCGMAKTYRGGGRKEIDAVARGCGWKLKRVKARVPGSPADIKVGVYICRSCAEVLIPRGKTKLGMGQMRLVKDGER